jgi:hypothetical protein
MPDNALISRLLRARRGPVERKSQGSPCAVSLFTVDITSSIGRCSDSLAEPATGLVVTERLALFLENENPYGQSPDNLWGK